MKDLKVQYALDLLAKAEEHLVPVTTVNSHITNLRASMEFVIEAIKEILADQ